MGIMKNTIIIKLLGFLLVTTVALVLSACGAKGKEPVKNHLPIAQSIKKSTNENTPVSISLLGTDADADPVTYHIINSPVNGHLSDIVNNIVSYTPNANFAAEDYFTYRVFDGKGYSNIATVILTVQSVNLLPVAKPVAKVTVQNVPVNIVLNATDADGDALTYDIQSNPKNGRLSHIVGNNVTYSPNTGFAGEDSFTYRAHDGKGYSNIAKVSISIKRANTQPTINEVTNISTSIDITLTLLPKGEDADGDQLTYLIVSSPANGNVKSTGDRISYKPNKGFVGKDRFTYKAYDGYEYSNIGVVNISVVNDKLDISLDLAVQLSRTQLTGDMYKVVVTNTHAFIAAGESGLHIISNIDGSQPKRIKTLTIGGYALSVTLSKDEKTLFIAGEDAGLVLVDISSPSKARIVSKIESYGFTEAVTLSADEKYAYIADADAGLTIIDITNHGNPQLLGNAPFPNSGYASSLKLSADEKYAFVASSMAGLNVFDISNSNSPFWIAQLKTTGNAHDVVLSHDYTLAFVASGKGGVDIIDILSPKNPIRKRTWTDTPPSNVEYPINANSLSLLSDGITLLVATEAPGIYRIDVSGDIPVTKDYKDTPSFANSFVLSKDETKLFVMDAFFSLLVYDIRKDKQ